MPNVIYNVMCMVPYLKKKYLCQVLNYNAEGGGGIPYNGRRVHNVFTNVWWG